jgi:nucleoside-diphosphate-sugar epimerase
MRLAITGGSGLIGRHVIPELAEEHKIIICDIETPPTSLLELDGVTHHICDVSEVNDLVEAFAGCDAVFHKAGLKGGVSSFEQPHRYYEINVRGSLNVMKASEEAAVGNIIFDSTESIYGTTDESAPFTEETPPKPSSIYGGTKHLSEIYLNVGTEIDVTVFRYPRVVFPDEPNAITRFYNMIINGSEIELYNEGRNAFDFVHIDDVVRAHRQTIEKKFPTGIFNIATADEKRLDELVEDIGQFAGVTPKYERISRNNIKAELIEDDLLPHINSLDSERSRDILGVAYEFPKVEDIIEETLTRLKDNHGD